MQALASQYCSCKQLPPSVRRLWRLQGSPPQHPVDLHRTPVGIITASAAHMGHLLQARHCICSCRSSLRPPSRQKTQVMARHRSVFCTSCTGCTACRQTSQPTRHSCTGQTHLCVCHQDTARLEKAHSAQQTVAAISWRRVAKVRSKLRRLVHDDSAGLADPLLVRLV